MPPVRVIQNIVDEREILQLAQVDVDFDVDPSCVNVICVGRLDKTKNPLGALGDFATALKTNDRLRLYFLGKGALADAVARETDRLGVGDKVFLLGAKPNPYPYIGKMDVLLLESLFEGQGVVLREAEALGLGLVFPRRLEKYNQNIYGCDCVAEALTRAVKRPDSALGGRLDAYNEGNRRAVSDLLESCR